MRVLAISGSLRRGSHNTELLRAAEDLLPPSVELELFDGLKAVEPYDEDDDVGGGPAGAHRLRDAIETADAILIAAPEYNSSLPGQLKNAVDAQVALATKTVEGANNTKAQADALALVTNIGSGNGRPARS